MSDVFYIVVTVIFGLFVLFIAWWLYRYMKKDVTLSELKNRELSDTERQTLQEFCKRMKQEVAEKENEHHHHKSTK